MFIDGKLQPNNVDIEVPDNLVFDTTQLARLVAERTSQDINDLVAGRVEWISKELADEINFKMTGGEDIREGAIDV